MNVRKFLMFMASVALVFWMITGCGSSGDSDGGGTTPLPEVGLEPEKVNDFLEGIADELGCTYTELTTALSKQSGTTAAFNTVGLVKKVLVAGKNVKNLAVVAPLISATEAGTCGGTITLPDEGLDGTIILDNYCLSAEEIGAQTTIDGSITLAVDEVAETITASTPTPIRIKSTNPETGDSIDVTIDLDSGVLTIHEDGTMRITVSALTITDNVTNKEYKITNFRADIGEESLTFSGTFDNPEVTGAVEVEGSINIDTGVGTITATDQDGVEVTLSTTATEGVFDVSFDGAPLGTVDCSDLDVEVPDILEV